MAKDEKDKRIAELEAENRRLAAHGNKLYDGIQGAINQLSTVEAERDQLAAKYDAEHEAYMDLFRQLSEYERKELAGELVPAASLETARRALEHFTTHYNDGVIHEAKNALTQLSNPSAALEEACKHCGAVLEEDPCNGGMFCRKCHEEIMALEERHAQAEIPANGLERDRAVRKELLDKMSDIEVLLPIEDFMGTKRDLTAKFHIALIEKARREFGLVSG